jgi:hypothetical protein
MHSISSHELYGYVAELVSEKYAGRLTGTEGYNESARWLAGHFAKWGLEPAGDDGGYLQSFPNPYTLVLPDCAVSMKIQDRDGFITKEYRYYDEFVPGSTSGSGEVTGEVVYVGYGITAPELGYDDYHGVDVKGKIVLMEREAPVSPGNDRELFMKWRPYSFHQYKLENAAAQGAAGMLYTYGPLGNPNNSYIEGFVYSHVGRAVVSDVFSGTGRTHQETVDGIRANLQPRSFATGKTFKIKNSTRHYPDGIGYNVMGLLKGSDARLNDEVIMMGGHLDHLGRCYETMPGANDNASAVAVTMAVAKAMAGMRLRPRRSVLFVCFGAEEQAVAGSKYYLDHPLVPLERTSCLINIDGVGCGEGLRAAAGRNYPSLWEYFEANNDRYIHRPLGTSYFANLGRPRLDAARFMWSGVPSLSFSSYGADTHYHTPGDNLSIINPEIMEDLARLIFLSVLDIANRESIDFRKDAKN